MHSNTDDVIDDNERAFSTVVKTLSPPVEKFHRIIERCNQSISELEKGLKALQLASEICPGFCLSGAFGNASWYNDDLYNNNFDKIRKNIYLNTWHALFEESNLTTVMNHEDIKHLKEQIEKEAPEVDINIVISTFQEAFAHRHSTFQRGLVTVFQNLYACYKSNDPFRIEDRVIIHSALCESLMYWNRGRGDEINDLARIFLLLDGSDPGALSREQQYDQRLLKLIRNNRSSSAEKLISLDYFRIRWYQNGNVHLWFPRQDLVDKANKIIAGYYGNVLAQRAK
ncbi:MAG: DUF4942 domain-containing protein [Gammaproteobacteria bacterium]|nr:DUF4942 domain-containing protein [Gammaproteobacteria bacterium]MDH5728863.1 DUF4942 domain-containing protein [Gammaproteobacteria bacterium]